jgi:3-methyladenine DNA glycosylase Tag
MVVYPWPVGSKRPENLGGDPGFHTAFRHGQHKVLKSEGFSFVGSTICYLLLQTADAVNDHLVHCFRYRELIER